MTVSLQLWNTAGQEMDPAPAPLSEAEVATLVQLGLGLFADDVAEVIGDAPELLASFRGGGTAAELGLAVFDRMYAGGGRGNFAEGATSGDGWFRERGEYVAGGGGERQYTATAGTDAEYLAEVGGPAHGAVEAAFEANEDAAAAGARLAAADAAGNAGAGGEELDAGVLAGAVADVRAMPEQELRDAFAALGLQEGLSEQEMRDVMLLIIESKQEEVVGGGDS